MGRDRHIGGRAGFTLIEMLAVVALFILMATFAMPNLALLRDRALRQQAQRIAAQLELGRQRSVVTSIPHRLVIDLDNAAYRLEWLATDAEARGESALGESPLPVPVAGGRPPIDLVAPREAQRSFQPVPGQFGRYAYLEPDLFFSGVETDQGWTEVGETFVAFERDGTTDYAAITLEDDAGRGLVLDVLPLADAVRIRDVEL